MAMLLSFEEGIHMKIMNTFLSKLESRSMIWMNTTIWISKEKHYKKKLISNKKAR